MRPKPVPLGAAAAAIAVLAAVSGCSGSSSSPAAAPSPARAAAATTVAPSTPDSVVTVPAPESTRALCEVQGSRLDDLMFGATGDGRFEQLRDAIPELDSRIGSVDAAMAGRPGLKPLSVSLHRVYDDWVKALRAYDGHDAGGATAAMNDADTALATAKSAARSALPTAARCAP
jgi:hypothetical protein